MRTVEIKFQDQWLRAPENDAITKVVQEGRVWDQEVWKWVEERLRPNQVFIDIGAFFGQMSILAVRRSLWVNAFECNPELFGMLLANTVRSGCINAYGAPLWSTAGVQLYMQEETHHASAGALRVMQEPTGTVLPPSVTLDSIPLMLGAEISVMKIDVQGADLHVMMGGEKLIRRYRPPIIFEYEEDLSLALGHTWGDYERFIDSIGYTITGELRGSGKNYTIESTEKSCPESLSALP